MQQAFIFLPASSTPFLSTKQSNTLLLYPAAAKQQHHHRQCVKQLSSTSVSIKAKAKAAAAGSEAPEVDYNSMESSVFPAEACETLGGVACDVEMFPETKLKQAEPKQQKKVTSHTVNEDREYLQYEDNPKTVFIAEACDDLGGEFCEPTYQNNK